MEELKKELNAVYDLMKTIPVRGDLVEVMAEARRHMRQAYKLTETQEEKENG